MSSLNDKNILLIISGGIAAYKILELIRLIKKAGGHITPILTKSGAEFVTPLSVSALAENTVYTDLFSLKDESEMGHIRLSREADLILVAPATANIMAKTAHGIADDLGTTCLLASDKPIMMAPAMNPMMWDNQATQDNIATLKQRGIHIIEPHTGDMACGETGQGRLPEADQLFERLEFFFSHSAALKGKHALVTAGPTYESIDPVRFIGNHSSGKQGFAIAQALHNAGATVSLISGPSALPTPSGVNRINVTSAQDMLAASEDALPCDIAICSAAVSDWRPVGLANHKIKKDAGAPPPTIALQENPDILKTLSNHKKRPRIVIGFAAETNDLIKNAQDKIQRKGCDWICANDVLKSQSFGNDRNSVYCLTPDTHEEWLDQSKQDIAQNLVQKIIKELG